MGFDFLREPLPWYVAGPLIGLIVPLLLIVGGKQFGISSNLRHLCAAVLPTRNDFFRYDWKKTGSWNLAFGAGILIGGFIGGNLLSDPQAPMNLSQGTVAWLGSLGVYDLQGLAPGELFTWNRLASFPGLLIIVGGGFLIGFGSRYAGGCTSGHAISGLADLQFPSLVAVIGFFVGGLMVTHFLLPLIL